MIGETNVTSPPRIESLTVNNYRALANFEMKDLTPFTVLLGPNGSGKSTVFDVFAFLAEAFATSLRTAWDRRGRFKELRTRDQDGGIQIQIKYRERKELRPITYALTIEEDQDGPIVKSEILKWRRGSRGQPFRFLAFDSGEGVIYAGDTPDEDAAAHRVEEKLTSRELLAVNTLGQLKDHPRVTALRNFIVDWYLCYLTADSTRSIPDAGPQERLSMSGDNLPNVLQYLKERHSARLDAVLASLCERIPRLGDVNMEIMPDGRLLLRIKDIPFRTPILSRYASDGTMKMLAYLVLLNDPKPPRLIGIEEPENQLHPRLLQGLAEECRKATNSSQLLVTTHSPEFVNGLSSNELWVLARNESGHTKATRVLDIPNIRTMEEHGAKLGDLWMEGYLGGDPLFPDEPSFKGSLWG